MRNLLRSFLQLWERSDEFQQKAGAYERALKTEEWKFLKDTLLVIKGEMLGIMFSQQFTKLDATEKDVIQRTYYNINQVLDYLLNPVGWLRRKQIKLNPHLTGIPTRKGKKDGRKSNTGQGSKGGR